MTDEEAKPTMRKVYTAPNAMLAHHLLLLLDTAGIPAVVQGAGLESQDVGLGVGVETSTMPTVWIVDEKQLEQALAIVADFESQDHDSEGQAEGDASS